MQELRKIILVPSAKKVAQETIAILNMVRMCEKFNTFPRAGGLFDQDALFVTILNYIMVCDYEHDRMEEAKTNARARSGR